MNQMALLSKSGSDPVTPSAPITEAAEQVSESVRQGITVAEGLKRMITDNSVRLLIALVTLGVGILAVRFLTNLLKAALLRIGVDPAAAVFIAQVSYGALVLVLLMLISAMLGYPGSAFLALFGALGLAVGLALKDNLANFASGILILLFRPFKAGDFIECNNAAGTVREVNLMSTILYTVDRKEIILPNSNLTSENVINYSSSPDRRIRLILEIDAQSDYKEALAIIRQVLLEDPAIRQDPAPLVELQEFGAGYIKLIAMPWVGNDAYWDAYYRIIAAIKDRFDQNGIHTPQMLSQLARLRVDK